MFHTDLADVLPLVLQHLRIPDVLRLSMVSKEGRAAVIEAWKHAAKPRLRALLVASKDNRLLLLDPLAGTVLRTAQVGAEVEGGWPTSVTASTSGDRCWVCQYEGDTVIEHRLPCLSPQAELSGGILPEGGVAEGLEEPEGIVHAHGRLYVAWAGSCCVTSHWLGDEGPELSACSSDTARSSSERPQRLERRQLGSRLPWGMCLGPDNALYIAVNPPYWQPSSEQSGSYGQLPEVLGQGSVVRLQLDKQGQFVGRPKAFTARGCLSRPSGLCFDDSGDLYVTHMAAQVLKFAGPGRGSQAGQLLGVFIDTQLPELGLVVAAGGTALVEEERRGCSAGQTLSLQQQQQQQQQQLQLQQSHQQPPLELAPKPFDICWFEGLFFLTTHNCCEDGGDDWGRLSVWDESGALLRVHHLAPHCHPNMLHVFHASA